jgi:myo-inositol-1(or 4)-monophosphatase
VSATARELADLALGAARAAAELVRERARGHVTVAATKSSDVDVVTEADRASEQLIRDYLLAARPDDAFLGEESLGEEGDDRSSGGVRWVVDPIDGTVNFLYGIPQYAVSIAAEVDGDVVAGVVLDVQHGTEYVGHVADGDVPATATRDGRPIAVRGPAPMAERLIATGFSYDRRVRVLQAEAVTRLLPQVRDVRRLGSCALDLCLVADGRMDGYVEEGVNHWDHAAAGLIARIAGARTQLDRGVGGLDLLVCGPAHGFDELLRVIRDAGFSSSASPDPGE